MDKIEPKYRRPLNTEQMDVLKLLFRFRYITADQLARYCGRKNATYVQKRLRILAEQGYIAKRYEGSYRLQGRPAEYYLLPKGARLLREDEKFGKHVTDQAIKNLYKDKTASDFFMAHCIAIFEMFLKFKPLHSDKMVYATKIQLKRFDYMPQPLPDVYIHIPSDDEQYEDWQYLLDYFEDSVPLFVIIARIKKYLKYSGEGDWESEAETSLPTILLVCDSKRRQKQILRRIAKELRESYEEVRFGVAILNELIEADDGAAWRMHDEPDEVYALGNF
jgi:hypothetical protein